jgi:hypothetical protein
MPFYYAKVGMGSIENSYHISIVSKEYQNLLSRKVIYCLTTGDLSEMRMLRYSHEKVHLPSYLLNSMET